MDKVLAIYHYLIGPSGAVIFAALYALCEALALNPKVKSNSVFQLIANGVNWALNKIKGQ